MGDFTFLDVEAAISPLRSIETTLFDAALIETDDSVHRTTVDGLDRACAWRVAEPATLEAVSRIIDDSVQKATNAEA
jgi:hypothetical protein